MKVHAIDYSFTGSINITETVENGMFLLYIRTSEAGLKADIAINGKKLSNRPVLLDLLELPNNQVIMAEIPKGSTLNITLYASDTNVHIGQIALIGVEEA
jgi:hypothetical protein